MSEPAVFVGIDVAKATLDVAVRPSGAGWVSANDEAGIQAPLGQGRAVGPTPGVVEAAGGHGPAAPGPPAPARGPRRLPHPPPARARARAPGQPAPHAAV